MREGRTGRAPPGRRVRPIRPPRRTRVRRGADRLGLGPSLCPPHLSGIPVIPRQPRGRLGPRPLYKWRPRPLLRSSSRVLSARNRKAGERSPCERGREAPAGGGRGGGEHDAPRRAVAARLRGGARRRGRHRR
jgi:hypothetical protein